MQTFNLTLQLSLTAVVPAQFLEEARKEAQAADAPLFLRTMQEKYPEDDDQFMLAVVKNAMRTQLRVSTVNFMARSGVGGGVSPVQIVAESITQPKAAVVEFAEATDPDRVVFTEERKAQQLRIGHDTPGALVNGLVQERAE